MQPLGRIRVFGALLTLIAALTFSFAAEPTQKKDLGSKSKASPTKKTSPPKHVVKHPPSSIHGKKPRQKRRSRRLPAQRVPDRGRTRQIQERLIASGALDTTPNGVWDARRMEESLRKYQAMKGLTVTGKLDVKTLKSMGL